MSMLINPFGFGGGGGGPVAVTDAFNRANSTTSLGNADTGQAWVPVNGVWGILSNAAYIVTAGTSPNISAAVIDTGGADGTLQVTFAVWNSNMGIFARLTDINNYIVLQYNSGVGLRVLKRVAGGAYATIIAPVGGIANGDVIKLTMSGSNYEMFRNGVSKGTGSDAFNSTATKHGIGGDGLGSTPRWDDFSYTP